MKLEERPDWVTDAVFYQIFPDRFARSAAVRKPANLEAWEAPPTLSGFKGGDLIGVTEKLDYLHDLGITALFLNPVFASAANHRYHTHDYFHVDPILGGDAALRRLLDEAHARGMRVILDGVFNHAGRGFYQFLHTLENGIQSPYVDWFHFNRAWLESGRPLDAYGTNDGAQGSDSYSRYGYHSWWGLPALPKFNTNHPDVRAFLFEVGEHWIKQGIDGWRLDVPNEIDDDAFWREFRARVRAHNPDAYIVGEIWEDPTRWIAGNLFDGVTSYQFTQAALGFSFVERLDRDVIAPCGLKHAIPLGPQAFAERLTELYATQPQGAIFSQMNLLGSHDTPRLVNMGTGDEDGVLLAYTSAFGFPGAPCVYYGDEIGMAGRHDPDCRRGFEWDDKLWNRRVHAHVRALARARQESKALRRGDFQILRAEDGVVAWRRRCEGDEALVVVNQGVEPRTITLQEVSGVADGAFRDVLHPTSSPLRASGHAVTLEVAGRSGRLLVRSQG